MIRFDDAIPALIDVVDRTLGPDALTAGVVLRDYTGRLTFIAAAPIPEPQRANLEASLQGALGAYARSGRALVASEPGEPAPELLVDPAVRSVDIAERRVRMIDRRLAGADWLREPVNPSEGPPRFVFASMKGGVGRSTALAVVANRLAMDGLSVLVVDLDIEAPGVGVFLLSEETTPDFGTLDALLEATIAPLDATFVADLVAPSTIGQGRIRVCPVFGRRSLDHPENILGKISRIYGESVGVNDEVLTPLDQVRSLLQRLEHAANYDTVLVDARAGLHELTAAAVLGIGAEVFLFGQDEPQTFQAYRALFAHLRRFVDDDPAADWLDRITPVHAKAAAAPDARAAYIDGWRALVSQTLLPSPPTSPADPDPVEFASITWLDEAEIDAQYGVASNPYGLHNNPYRGDPYDDMSVNTPIPVFFDAHFVAFNPLARQDQLGEALVEATFGALFERIRSMLPTPETVPQ